MKEKEMTKNELNTYRHVLEAKHAEIVLLVRNRDGIAIERSSDAFDEVQQATERELAIRNLDRDSNVLRKVRGALGRIAGGDFGVCMHCEENISPGRLAAVPWAEFCIRCQETADLGHGDAADNVYPSWVNAA
jgi:DnaK suppressor protein